MPSIRIASTLVHTIRPPANPAAGPPPALLLLHGQGANEQALLRLAASLDPRFFIISIRAPYPHAGRGGGYTWYDVVDAFTPHPEQFRESIDRLERFLSDVKPRYSIDGGRLFMLGFSMGSVVALALALSVPGIVRGVVAHSGYIPEIAASRLGSDRFRALSIFLAHGLHDPVIPVHLARRARALLSRTEADLTYREYPAAHRISAQSLRDAGAWLADKLAAPARR